MIERQVTGTPAAILAGIGVPEEDFAAGKFHSGARRANEANETNDRWVGKCVVRGRNQAVVRLQDLGFATENQHNRAARVADVEGFVILVENQDRFVHT